MPCNLSGLCCWKAKGNSRVGVKQDKDASNEGNPRNKCALQPGHSLMDWIRLGNSGKDLTGVGPKAGRLTVTLKELANHDKESDCWLAIRGRVYNVTAYLPFHPGGVDELMKGAGKDATTLFDQVHPWVNYDSILQKCLIGRLVSADSGVNKEELFFGGEHIVTPTLPRNPPKTPQTLSPSNTIKIINNQSPSKDASPNSSNTKEFVESSVQTPDVEETVPLPRFDWIQKMNSITVIFYTGAFSNPAVEISPPNEVNELQVLLTYSKNLFTNELQFLQPVEFPCKLKVYCETGKVELVFMKQTSDIWDNYGILRQNSRQIIQGSGRNNFVVADKKKINNNTYLLKFERIDKYRYVIPIGKHVRVFAPVKGSDISRSYTAVPETLFSNYGPKADTTDSLCLMVKRYADGPVSSYITDLEKGDDLCASQCLGNFELDKLEKLDKFLLLAAGTGITPMLSLIIFLLERRIKKCQTVTLLFFNRTPDDILFKSQFDDLASQDKRLKVKYILSDPAEDWLGLTGRINTGLVKSTIGDDLKDTIYTHKDMYSCVCGPNAFVEVSENILRDVGFSTEQIHCFLG